MSYAHLILIILSILSCILYDLLLHISRGDASIVSISFLVSAISRYPPTFRTCYLFLPSYIALLLSSRGMALALFCNRSFPLQSSQCNGRYNSQGYHNSGYQDHRLRSRVEPPCDHGRSNTDC